MSVMTPRASRNAGFLRSTLTCLLLEPGDPSSRSGYDSGSGNGNDEAPAFLPVLVQIPHDLLREIPRQEERVVRLRPQQLRVGPHRDVRAPPWISTCWMWKTSMSNRRKKGTSGRSDR